MHSCITGSIPHLGVSTQPRPISALDPSSALLRCRTPKETLVSGQGSLCQRVHTFLELRSRSKNICISFGSSVCLRRTRKGNKTSQNHFKAYRAMHAASLHCPDVRRPVPNFRQFEIAKNLFWPIVLQFQPTGGSLQRAPARAYRHPSSLAP